MTAAAEGCMEGVSWVIIIEGKKGRQDGGGGAEKDEEEEQEAEEEGLRSLRECRGMWGAGGEWWHEKQWWQMQPADRLATEKPSEWNGGIRFHHKHSNSSMRRRRSFHGEQQVVLRVSTHNQDRGQSSFHSLTYCIYTILSTQDMRCKKIFSKSGSNVFIE